MATICQTFLAMLDKDRVL